MRIPLDFDKAALEVFSDDGAPAGPDPLRLLCIGSPADASAFHPRRMPSLAVACPGTAGAPQRFRGPLWRPFKPSSP